MSARIKYTEEIARAAGIEEERDYTAAQLVTLTGWKECTMHQILRKVEVREIKSKVGILITDLNFYKGKDFLQYLNTREKVAASRLVARES